MFLLFPPTILVVGTLRRQTAGVFADSGTISRDVGNSACWANTSQFLRVC